MAVTVRAGDDRTVKVLGPQEAVEFMDSRWPSERGFLFAAARDKCVDEAGRMVATEVSRQAFRVAAAEGAILPMREPGNVLKM